MIEPFALALNFATGSLGGYTSRIERRVSALRGACADAEALDALVAAGDPMVYEVEQRDVPEEIGQLICCTTVIQPGVVGEEYFMTKGHYHADRETGEVYVGLAGQGYLLLQSGQQAAELRMERGTVAYVPPGWAHRTVNTGEIPFVFFAVYPGQAGHDYTAIEESGFGRRVMRTAAGPVVTEREPS
jgi:glucose-6-phosphate isomerase